MRRLGRPPNRLTSAGALENAVQPANHGIDLDLVLSTDLSAHFHGVILECHLGKRSLGLAVTGGVPKLQKISIPFRIMRPLALAWWLRPLTLERFLPGQT